MQNLLEAIKSKGPAFEKVFNLCYEYKLKWNKEHYTTPILSALVFNKLKAILGGKLNFLLSGSAPLSAETQVCMISIRKVGRNDHVLSGVS